MLKTVKNGCGIWVDPIPLLVGNTEPEGGRGDSRLLTPTPLSMTLGNWIGEGIKLFLGGGGVIKDDCCTEMFRGNGNSKG